MASRAIDARGSIAVGYSFGGTPAFAGERLAARLADDPVDDCTIWYVGDYLRKSAADSSTRIGTFRLAGCGP